MLRRFGVVDGRLVEEAHGHLVDAAERERSRGLDSDAAERAAIAQFGTPASLAARVAIPRHARTGASTRLACGRS